MIRDEQIKYITDKLGELRSKIEVKSTLNLTNINLSAEDFYCRLFNIVRKSHHQAKQYGDVNHYIDTKIDIWDYKDLTKKDKLFR